MGDAFPMNAVSAPCLLLEATGSPVRVSMGMRRPLWMVVHQNRGWSSTKTVDDRPPRPWLTTSANHDMILPHSIFLA